MYINIIYIISFLCWVHVQDSQILVGCGWLVSSLFYLHCLHFPPRTLLSTLSIHPSCPPTLLYKTICLASVNQKLFIYEYFSIAFVVLLENSHGSGCLSLVLSVVVGCIPLVRIDILGCFQRNNELPILLVLSSFSIFLLIVIIFSTLSLRIYSTFSSLIPSNYSNYTIYKYYYPNWLVLIPPPIPTTIVSTIYILILL